MDRVLFSVGGVLGAVGVALGAFGAHVLKLRLGADRLAVFETGARYQLIHALALLVTAMAVAQRSTWPWKTAGWLFAAGILLFSGSLYALALSGAKWIGVMTPLGGMAFLAGWMLLAWGAWRRR
jgi:uncharacterized membrane protein YgdD (TMEM256/DUF423 family)